MSATKDGTPQRRRRARDRPSKPVVSVKVTPQERRRIFAAHYRLNRNATQAAIAAGLAPKSAYAEGHKLLKHPEVIAWLAESERREGRIVQRAARKLEVTRETIIDELARIGFSNPMDYGRIEGGQFVVDLSATPREEMGAIRKLKVHERVLAGEDGAAQVLSRRTEIELAGKREALVDLGKAIGLFRDDGSLPVTVNFNLIGLYPPEDPRNVQQPHPAEQPAQRPRALADPEFNDPARRR